MTKKISTKGDMTARPDSGVSINDIDLDPMKLGDSVMIELFEQRLLLEFDTVDAGGVKQYTLIDVRHKDNYTPFVRIHADQILLPLCQISKINPDDAILHLKKDDNFLLRILSRQLNKSWYLVNGKLNVTSSGLTDESWTIEITDHHSWSTS